MRSISIYLCYYKNKKLSIDKNAIEFIYTFKYLFMSKLKKIDNRKVVDLIEKNNIIKARVYKITQYERNAETGESYNFNENNIESALSHRTIKRYAWICHNRDYFSLEEEASGKGKEIEALE